jgi:hypothetical protein
MLQLSTAAAALLSVSKDFSFGPRVGPVGCFVTPQQKQNVTGSRPVQDVGVVTLLTAVFVLKSYRQSLGLRERGISLSQGRYPHRTAQNTEQMQTSAPRVRCEPTIPLFERTNTFCSGGRSVAVQGLGVPYRMKEHAPCVSWPQHPNRSP